MSVELHRVATLTEYLITYLLKPLRIYFVSQVEDTV